MPIVLTFTMSKRWDTGTIGLLLPPLPKHNNIFMQPQKDNVQEGAELLLLRAAPHLDLFTSLSFETLSQIHL